MLNTGDIITTTCIDIPLCYHLGICVDHGGKTYVLNATPTRVNSFGGNIVCQELDDFIGTGSEKREIISVHPSGLEKRRILIYADENKKRKWDAFRYNCESFVHGLFTNGTKTTQMTRLIIVVAVGFSIYLLATRKKKA